MKNARKNSIGSPLKISVSQTQRPLSTQNREKKQNNFSRLKFGHFFRVNGQKIKLEKRRRKETLHKYILCKLY